MNLSPLKAYALDKKVPIITDEALRFLETMIVKHKIKDVLEIGTAIGYSALAMASFGCHVVTFERDEFMIDEAKRHFDWYDEQKRITLMPFDALTYQGELPMFDLIFIDAAKSQYQTFFKKYTPYLKKGGFVVCDNLHFHHLNPEVVNRHTQGLLKKLELFKSFLTHHPHFDTQFYDEGDGISLSRRKVV
ncbi:MAG TPA: class I SAM-dependent methyltransferase [Acholeplasmataceae bacterium]|mgnify:FL=1|nr:class I SAM-dependent methyltransferase [Acholeplasmataceae bacterium]